MFKWTPECQAELERIKKCLTSDLILQPFDPNKDIIIPSDASIYGYRWCCLQRDDNGQLYAISYGVKSTSATGLKSELVVMIKERNSITSGSSSVS